MSLSPGPFFNFEVAWSGGPQGCSANDGGSTGGFSAYWAAPPYQSSLSLPSRGVPDRKSTRLNSSHLGISYAVFCLKKKNKIELDPLYMAGSLYALYYCTSLNT